MGFFSDLKEDLSQAVNELMPDDNTESSDAEETVEAEKAEDTVVSEELAESVEEAEETVEEVSDDFVDAELEAMLNQLEAEEVAEEVTDDDISELLDSIAVSKPVKETKGERIMDVQFSHNEVEDETSVITKGMVITGDIVSKGSVDVLGGINGNIDILGKLNVTGSINGNSKAAEVFADNAKIVGEVISDVP